MENYPLLPVKQEKDLRELILNSASRYEGRDMFRYKQGEQIVCKSHAQFVQDYQALGNALLALGLADRKIAIVGETTYEWIVAYFAVACGIGVTVPVDKELPDNEIANVIRDSGATAVIYSSMFDQTIPNIRAGLPQVTHYIGMMLPADTQDALSMYALIANAQDHGYTDRTIDPDALMALIYTSGTTGKSKGVMLTHHNFCASAVGALSMLNFRDVCLSVLPVHHSFEFCIGILCMMQHGTTICINDSLRNFLPNLNLFKPKMICVVPLFATMMYQKIWAGIRAAGKEDEMRAAIAKSNELLAQGIDKREEFFGHIRTAFGGNLEMILCGGAPLSTDIIQGLRELGFEFIFGYGITECAPLVAVNRALFYKDGSVGPAISCCTVEIREKDENGDGEIWVKGENVMLGYYQNPEATAEVLQDGWFNTGDIGNLDAQGFLSITGRKKNLIVLSNGKNIYPEEIEDYMMRIPYLKEVVVYSPLRDGVHEDKLCAEVFLAEEFSAAHSPQEQEATLRKDLNELNKTLPTYKQVRDFHIRDTEFPKTTKKSIKRFTVG